MSTTFWANSGAVLGYVVTCGCPDAVAAAPRFGSYADAANALTQQPVIDQALPGCESADICVGWDGQVDAIYADPAPSINVNTSNASALLRELGYDLRGDESGEEDAEVFYTRALLARGLLCQDQAKPGTESGRWITGGRRSGYLQERLTELMELGEFCKNRQLTVCWS